MIGTEMTPKQRFQLVGAIVSLSKPPVRMKRGSSYRNKASPETALANAALRYYE
jgi:hypothetical protein